MTTLLPVPKASFREADGTPLAGGKVDFFEAGSATPKDTFTDFGGLTANPNPVILDANGEADIWLQTGKYKVVLKTSADVVRWTVDDVAGLGAESLILQTVDNIVALRALIAASSTLVEVLGYFNPPGTTVSGFTEQADAGGGLFYFDADSTVADNKGTVIIPDALPASGRWVRIFDGPVSIKWFGAIGDYILDSGAVNGSANDNTTEINDTCAYARTHNLAVRVPSGNYEVGNIITCGVPMIGEQKPRIGTNVKYGDATWGNASNFEGSFIIWDKSVLTTNSIHMQNTADNSQNVKFKNIAFMSQSSASVGGGTLLEVTTPAATTKYDFGNTPPFEDCYILNFTIGIKVETFRALNVNTVEFRGCQRATLLGIITTDLAEQISFNQCNFKQCGDGSTEFIKIENCEAINFNQCLFDTTSEIGIRSVSAPANPKNGILFSQCYYLNQKNSSGVGGGTFAFIASTAESDAKTGTISLYKCQGGADAGDIDLSLSPTTASLTLIDSDLKTDTNGTNLILAATGTVTRLGNVITGTTTGTDLDNRFTTDDFQYEGIKFTRSGTTPFFTRNIRTVVSTNKEILRISPTDTLLSGDGSLIEMKANEDTGGAADLNLDAGDGSNPGDINLTTKAGQSVKVNTAKLDIDTGDLEVGGQAHLESNEITITASTTQTQGQQPLTKNWNQISVVANTNDTVTLPTAKTGLICGVRNDGANTLQIFPASGDRIDNNAVDVAITTVTGTAFIFVATDATRWWVFASA